MKKFNLIFFALLILTTINSFSQTYNMGNGIDSTCSGTFYDNGGLGLYTANQNLTQTFCSNTPGKVIKVSFTSFQLDPPSDNITIYDGPNTSSPLIGVFSGTSLNGVSFKSTTGCLTFNFISDGSKQHNGWTASLSCEFECQAFIAKDSTNPLTDTSALKIIRGCKGSVVNFFGDADYPNSGNYYNQSNSTSTFTWKSGDGFVFTGQNTSHAFNTNGVFDVNLIVKDTIGCPDTTLAARVIISDVPSFAGVNFFPNDSICFGDTVIIEVPTNFIPFTPPVLNNAGITFLPDGTGVSYRDTIEVSIFDPTATYQSGFLDRILLNMEHSYLGDLQISLACPNGNSAILHQYPGGSSTHLGEPVDMGFPAPTNPGIGYDYEFTHNRPKYGTMVSESNSYFHNYTDVLGNNYTNQEYLPSGSYIPAQNLNTSYAGCPLNGEWIITVTDNLNVDNGYIFSWGLKFDSLIRPPSFATTILPESDTSYWVSSPSIIAQPYDSIIVVSPSTSGSHPFTYYIEDNVGCIHDTTVNVYVKQKPKSNAGLDTITCRLDFQLAPIPTPGSESNKWTYYSNSSTGNSVINFDTIYNANTTVNEYSVFNYILNEIVDGCPTYADTVQVFHIQTINTIDVTVDKDTICIPDLVRFTNTSDMTFFDSIYWEFGDGAISSNQGTTSHVYDSLDCFDIKITLVNNLGCKVDSVLTDLVCSYPTPIVGYNYTPYEPIVPETTVTFSNTSTGATIYYWDFAGLGTSTLRDDSYEFPKTEGGQYPVKLLISNEGGCKDSITKIITINNPLSIWIPSSFTPNNDGINDYFGAVFNNDAVREYTIRIFDRWGESMFVSSDPEFIWDGTFKGKIAPIGVYIWKITWVEEFKTETFTKFGNVTLTR